MGNGCITPCKQKNKKEVLKNVKLKKNDKNDKNDKQMKKLQFFELITRH